MKRRFTKCYSQEIWKELESEKELNDIDIKLTLTIVKPLHASWLTNLYDYLTSQKGAEINECQYSITEFHASVNSTYNFA